MRNFQILGAVLGSVTLAAVAFAGPHRGGPMERIDEMAEELGLDDAQLAEIEAITEASRAETKALREQLRDAKEEMKALMDADQPNRRAIMNQIDEMGELKSELKKLKTGTMLDIRAILTPEQFEQMKALRPERGERGGRDFDGPRRHGPRGGGF